MRTTGRFSSIAPFKVCIQAKGPKGKSYGAFGHHIPEFDGGEMSITKERIALLSAREGIHFSMVGQSD